MKALVCLLSFMFFMVAIPAADAQEYGKMRLLKQRAAQITKQKNDFVARVLVSYNIPHERNAEGAVVRINLEGDWQNVNAIEIVPVLKESADKRQQVIAHELYFYTTSGILDLTSELVIR